MLLVKGICSTVAILLYSGGSRLSDKGGPDHPDPEIRGERVSKKIFFGLWASVWSKNKGGRPPPGTSPRSATAIERGVFAIAMIYP